MRYLTTCLLLLWATTSGAMNAWRWVDKDGVVHFSDQPMPGADKVQIKAAPKPGSVVSPYRPSAAASESEDGPRDANCQYTRGAVSGPSKDEVFQAADAVTVAFQLRPGYRAGDRIEALLNGQRITTWPDTATQFTLTGLARGTYTLSFKVIGADERTLCTAAPVEFHVQQPSLLTPGHKAAPRS